MSKSNYNPTIGINYSARTRWTARMDYRRRRDQRETIALAAVIAVTALAFAAAWAAVRFAI